MKNILTGLGLFLFVGNIRITAQPIRVDPPRYSDSRFAKLEFENDILQLRKDDARDGNFTNGVRLDLMGNFIVLSTL